MSASCLVRVWVRVRVRVWFAFGFVSGLSGSCPVRVRFVSGSCLVRVRLWSEFVFSSYLVRIRSGLFAIGFVSRFVMAFKLRSSSLAILVWFVFGSVLVRVWVRWFMAVSYLGS